MGQQCTICGVVEKGVSLFPVPKQEERLRQWKAALNGRKGSYVCVKHFDRIDITGFGCLRLSSSAVPCRIIPATRKSPQI